MRLCTGDVLSIQLISLVVCLVVCGFCEFLGFLSYVDVVCAGQSLHVICVLHPLHVCSKKYYDDTSHVLIAMMIRAIRPELLSKAGFHELSQPIEYVRAASSSADGGLDVTVSEPRGEELRCMVAIIRHGDRTAKQKLKLLTSHPLVIKLTESYTRKCVRACLGLTGIVCG